MGIKKSRGTALRKVSASYQVSKSGIKKAKQQVRPMGEDEESRETVPSTDPSHFLNQKEKKAWDRLPERRKQQYIKEAFRDVEKKKGARGIAASPEKEEKSQKKEKIQKEKWKIGKAWEEKERVQKGKERQGPDGLTERGDMPVSSHCPAGTAAPGRKSGAAPISPSGLTVLIAKRTAERFKEANRRKKAAIESRHVQIQSELARQMQDNREMGNLKQAAAFVTAAMASAILAVTTAAIQLAATVVATMLAILIPVIVVAVVIGVVASLIAGVIAALSTTYASGSGEDIVAVAIQEIGYRERPGNETKYGEFTGANGLAWCHSFVSWCANECGFIKMGILPKTASCEEGRQWFIHHQKYQEKEAGYIPQPGDILYFDYEGEGESHHVGIVEYTENDVVHTIEGNKRDQVMRAHYPLTYGGIMGYGQPDYPENGINACGSEQDFLGYCDSISTAILNDGNWVYSNSSLEGSFEKARNASVRKTNCAHYVSMAMQEFGTLKPGQFIYSNAENKLVASSQVKKQLEKYYEIIYVGGKMPAEAGLRAGDICLYHLHTNIYAGKNTNGKKVWYDYSRSQTSDGRENSGYFVKGMKTGDSVGGKIYTILRLKDQDPYGTGKTITLPSGLGDVYSYMGWSMVTNRLSRQYRLRVNSGEHYDANGFGKIGDRYVIACTSTFGEVGDEVDFVLANGRVIHGVIGDQKNQADSDCDKWGHQYGHCVVEFCVDKASWYGSGKTVTRYHPEWAGTTVVKAVNLGKNHLK